MRRPFPAMAQSRMKTRAMPRIATLQTTGRGWSSSQFLKGSKTLPKNSPHVLRCCSPLKIAQPPALNPLRWRRRKPDVGKPEISQAQTPLAEAWTCTPVTRSPSATSISNLSRFPRPGPRLHKRTEVYTMELNVSLPNTDKILNNTAATVAPSGPLSSS